MTTYIQGLVTDALLGADFEEAPESVESVIEIAQTSTNNGQVIAEGREVEEFLSSPAASVEEVRRAVARFGALYVANGPGRHYYNRGRGPIDGTTLLLMAHDYADAPSAEKVAEIREVIFRNNNYMESHFISRSVTASVDYLTEIWDEADLIERLSAYTGVKTPTVRKWVKTGATPNSGSGNKIEELARYMYELQAGCGMSRDDAAKWWDAPNPDLGGKSPDEAVKDHSGYSWALSDDVKQLIAKIGGGIGFQ